jgi:hypothetical protein
VKKLVKSDQKCEQNISEEVPLRDIKGKWRKILRWINEWSLYAL